MKKEKESAEELSGRLRAIMNHYDLSVNQIAERVAYIPCLKARGLVMGVRLSPGGEPGWWVGYLQRLVILFNVCKALRRRCEIRIIFG